LHSDYHTPNDDIEFINFEGQVDIVNYGINITKSIDGFDKISYLKTKDMAPHGGSSRGYADGVTMGIVPDFSSEEAGMGIQAVLDDKPAFKAGLKSGDLIVKLGDVEVKDIQDYMKALKTFKKGEKTTVEVMRDGKKLSFKLQF
jgi:S1-C subfamily serine protease